MSYDSENIFAKILRGEIPNNTVMETDYVLAFNDIAPQAPVHILVIPKGEYADIGDFSTHGTEKEITAFWRAIQSIVTDKGLTEDGYRIICNTGQNGGQEVPHFHAHILGGEHVGPMVAKSAA